MQTAALITRALKTIDQIPDPTNGAHARRRERYLEYAQEGVGELWLDPEEFPWTRVDGTVSISAAARSGLLPANWRKMGRHGSVWAPGTLDEPIVSIPLQDLQIVQQSGFTTSEPECYAIWGQDPTTRRSLIQVPVAGGAYTLTLRAYLAQVPTLSDSDSDSGLDQLPEDLVFRYLLTYLRWRGLDDRSDKRADKWEKRKDEAKVALRVASKGGENTTQFVAGFVEDDEEMW